MRQGQCLSPGQRFSPAIRPLLFTLAPYTLHSHPQYSALLSPTPLTHIPNTLGYYPEHPSLIPRYPSLLSPYAPHSYPPTPHHQHPPYSLLYFPPRVCQTGRCYSPCEQPSRLMTGRCYSPVTYTPTGHCYSPVYNLHKCTQTMQGAVTAQWHAKAHTPAPTPAPHKGNVFTLSRR